MIIIFNFTQLFM